jgi:uncharacterized protein (DUF362 family)
MKRCCGGKLSRREFMGQAGTFLSGGAALLGGAGSLLGCARGKAVAATTPATSGAAKLAAGATVAQTAVPAGAAKVAIARSPRIWSDAAGVNAEVLAEITDNALMWLTGTDSAEKAWGSLFNSDETVGLKPNGLGGMELATSEQLVAYCVDRLTGIGVKREKIIVWEQTPGFLANCGVPMDAIPWGVKAVITNQTLGQRIHQGTVDQPLTKVVTEWVDGFINLPILKDHGIAGVTLSMKNHYGTVQNPGGLHGNWREQIADLASIPVIKDKTRLILCDMTHCVVEGGPGGTPHYFPNSIMAARDMVAHDAVGARIIEEERARRGMPSLEQAGRAPAYLQRAQELGVGVADLSKVEQKVLDFA